jgi:hypothetical protein
MLQRYNRLNFNECFHGDRGAGADFQLYAHNSAPATLGIHIQGYSSSKSKEMLLALKSDSLTIALKRNAISQR